jgi:ribokinase
METCGGKGVNQAVAAARTGARVAFVGAVGRDHAGEVVRAVLTADGVDVSHLATLDVPTGRALIGVADSGENAIIVVPGANHSLDPAHVVAAGAAIGGARVVLAQLEVPLAVVEAAMTAAAPAATRVLNPAPAAPLPAGLLARLDLITPNEHEVGLLGGVDALRRAGVARVVVTEGSRGARLVDAAGERRIPPYPARSVDTTGAGDAFCGTLAARLAAGDDLEAALRAGSAAGALATQVAGAVPSLPRWEAVQRHMAGGHTQAP